MSQMYQVDNAFRYVYSSSLHERVQVKIVTLDGLIHKPSYEKLLEEPLLRFSGLYSEQCPSLMVKLQVYNNGEPFGLPVCTSYMPFETHRHPTHFTRMNICNFETQANFTDKRQTDYVSQTAKP